MPGETLSTNGAVNGPKGRNNRAGQLDIPATGGLPGRNEMAEPMEIDITRDKLGETLMARRQQLGLKVELVSDDIKVRPEFLRALEQEEFAQLPTVQHTRLFLKAYAERLGLNISEVYALYDLTPHALQEERQGYRWGPDVPLPSQAAAPVVVGTPDRGAPSQKLVVMAAGAIVVVGLLGWGVMKLIGSKSKESAPVTEPAVQVQQKVSPTEISKAVEQPPPPPVAEVTAEPVKMKLGLRVDRDTWVVLTADGDTVASTIMRAGQSVEAQAFTDFGLSLGHTQGVVLTADGKSLRALSAWAKSATGLVINADSIAAWSAAPDTATAPTKR